MGACGICGLASPNKRLFADSIKHRSCEDILFGCFCRVCDIKWSFNLQNKTDTHRPDSCLLKPVDLHVCFLLGTPHCYLTQAFTWCNLTDEGFIYHHLQIRAKKKEKTARNGCLVWTGADIHLSSRLQKTVCKFSGLNFNKNKISILKFGKLLVKPFNYSEIRDCKQKLRRALVSKNRKRCLWIIRHPDPTIHPSMNAPVSRPREFQKSGSPELKKDCPAKAAGRDTGVEVTSTSKQGDKNLFWEAAEWFTTTAATQ